MGEMGDRLRGGGNRTVGALKQGVGRLTGSQRLEIEGSVQRMRGDGQSLMARIKGALRRLLGR